MLLQIGGIFLVGSGTYGKTAFSVVSFLKTIYHQPKSISHTQTVNQPISKNFSYSSILAIHKLFK
jgi:hypothetical protein